MVRLVDIRPVAVDVGPLTDKVAGPVGHDLRVRLELADPDSGEGLGHRLPAGHVAQVLVDPAHRRRLVGRDKGGVDGPVLPAVRRPQVKLFAGEPRFGRDVLAGRHHFPDLGDGLYIKVRRDCDRHAPGRFQVAPDRPVVHEEGRAGRHGAIGGFGGGHDRDTGARVRHLVDKTLDECVLRQVCDAEVLDPQVKVLRLVVLDAAVDPVLE